MKTATAASIPAGGQPLLVKILVWWGYIFSAMYVLYGGVSIVLSILDRQYADMGKPITFLVLGLLLSMVVMAFRDAKAWGWYGLVTINGAIVVLALLSLTHIESIVLLVLAIAALGVLFAAPTKGFIFGER